MEGLKRLIHTTPCPMCGKSFEVTVDDEAYWAWRYGGKLIQEAMPELSLNDRELLKTGIDQACWDILFPKEEDVCPDCENNPCKCSND